MALRTLPWLPRLLAGALLLLAGVPGRAVAPAERGLPLIQAYEPSIEEAETQNFGIARDPRGVIYVANGGGVLIYDGAWWSAVPIGKETTAFTVASDASGRVAVGGQGEIGYLAPAAGGGMRYVSLTHLMPRSQNPMGQVLRLVPARGGFAFTTQDGVLVWDGTRITTVATSPGDRPFPMVFEAGGEALAWTRDLGVSRLAGARLVPVPGGEAFRGRRVDEILPAEGGLLVSVRGEGLFRLGTDGTVAPFAPAASKWAVAKRVLTGVRLADGRWALGSILGGVLLLRPDGEVEQVIDSSVGLPDDFVGGLTVDRDGALWAALDNGLARLQVASPLSVVDRRSGLLGVPRALVRHGGKLWIGSPAGVFTLEPDAAGGPVRARPVPWLSPAVWSLLSAGGDLLVGTAFGIYEAGPDAPGKPPRLIPGTDRSTAFVLLPSRRDPGRVWVGTDEGLAALHRDAGGWRLEGFVPGSPDTLRTLAEGADGTVWCGGQTEGVVGVVIAPGGPAAGARMRRLAGNAPGFAGVYQAGGRLLVVRGSGVLRVDEARGALVDDAAVSGLSGRGGATALAEDASGALWINTEPPAIAPRQGDGWSRTPGALVGLPARAVTFIHPEPDGVVWLGSDKGLFRYEAGSPGSREPLPAPRLARGAAGSRALFSGLAGEAPPAAELPPDARHLRIEYAPLSFRAGLRFQTRIEPLDADWNPPAPEPFTELARLAPGSYTFRVRTVGPNGERSPESSWSFRVAPPWYATAWAYALWAALALAAAGGWAWLRGRALRQRAARLEARVAEQTVELRRTVEELQQAHAELGAANLRLAELSLRDELTGIANRRQLQAALESAWGRACELGQPVAFVLLDLDHFKLLNDTRGHGEGDECLRRVARYLDGAMRRAGDLAARYGGEELAVLLPDADLDGGVRVAEQLRDGIERLAIPHLASPFGRVTASFGVAALVPRPGQPAEELIEAADLALYRAKTEGRNRVRAHGAAGEALASVPA